MKQSITKKQKEALQAVYESIKESGFPPTLADLREKLHVASNQSVLNFLSVLEERGYLQREKDQARGIKILNLGFKVLGKEKMVPLVGHSAAGSYVESFVDTFEKWVSLPSVIANEEVKKSKDDVFIIQVHGDSMVNVDIDDGDMLLVKESKEYKSGDIVIARTEDGTTVKRFIADGGKRYLKPENPAYQNIPIIPGEIQFQGKVILNLSKVK
ncbi:MAG: transcriptional repressor LexA [Candidatus Moranbacteria bacterium]|nr:transcriptional repressor LexA [Candidatus Moranbacteria bacterium]